MIIYTDAPKAYDYDYTVTEKEFVGTYGERRLRKVEVDDYNAPQRVEAQTDRYLSGLYVALDEDAVEMEMTRAGCGHLTDDEIACDDCEWSFCYACSEDEIHFGSAPMVGEGYFCSDCLSKACPFPPEDPRNPYG